MKSLFIESSCKFNSRRQKFHSFLFEEDYTKFDIIHVNSLWNRKSVFKEVLRANKIYTDTNLEWRPFRDGANLFNYIMSKVIAYNVKGKDVFIFRPLEEIKWSRLSKRLLREAFKYNRLHVREYTGYGYIWSEVDIEKLIKNL